MLRTARPEDRAAVEAIVEAAYSIHIERIGKPPGPMLDDYARLIERGAVSVLEEHGAGLRRAGICRRPARSPCKHTS